MAAPAPQIRPFREDDAKELQILFGTNVFERLPEANRKVYTHPLVLSAWVLVSAVFIQYMGWWPLLEYGYIGFLSPLPAFASAAVPILFYVDWIQRPYFETLLRQTLTSEDVLNIETYYSTSRSPNSRFSVVEWKERPIGYIAVDAANPDDTLTSLEIPETSSEDAKKPKSKTKPKTKQRDASNPLPPYALIRHFHVDRVYQPSGVQLDLARTVINDIFVKAASASSEKRQTRGSKLPTSQPVERILVRVTSVQSGQEKMWRQIGFEPSRTRKVRKVDGSKVIFGETEQWLELTSKRWENMEDH